MNVTCPQCSTIYRVDPAKVPQGGVRARCSACSGVIPVGMGGTQAQPPGHTQSAVSASPMSQSAGQSPARSSSLPPPYVPAPSWSPARSTPAGAAHPVSGVPAAPAARAPVTPGVPGAGIPASGQADVQPAAGGRRPINPFLSRDPGLRAKRLARALVSDMVAYYPAKHSEGLQKGTLKELFRDEIKKSYDEYVLQVGAEFARSTPHFQDALNEVLGAGRKIF